VSCFLDMERVTSQAQFVEIYAQTLGNLILKLDRVEKIRDFFRSLIPKIDFSPTGEVSVSVEFAKTSSGIERCLSEVMDLPQKIAEKYRKKVVVVFDEFQEVTNLNGPSFEKTLRSFIQHHKDVCYIFMGSKTHLIIDMFNDPKRAFYRSATVYPLGNIPGKELEGYVEGRFAQSGKKITKSMAQKIVRKARGLPHYVQMLAWHVWERSEKEVREEEVNEAIHQLLRAQNELYRTWLDGSTLSQRAVLRALADEVEIFSQEVMTRHNLGAASTVQSALKALVWKGFVGKEESRYALSDPFFVLWLRLQNEGKE
ncbi:MAG: ATP-binding protein, partial [Deltaproteobacteria bacterium]|nr:ATP-binding protein [Deltaproteobacteria bacterium]